MQPQIQQPQVQPQMQPQVQPQIQPHMQSQMQPQTQPQTQPQMHASQMQMPQMQAWGQPTASGFHDAHGLSTVAKGHEGPAAGGLPAALRSSGMSAEASHAAAMDQILG